MGEPVDLRRLLALIVTEDPAAAGEVRALADRLYALADRLDAARPRPPTDTGGTGDRVRIAVVGPDGVTKRTTDTGENSHAM